MEGTSSQTMVVAVDRIFTGSTRLETNAIGVCVWEGQKGAVEREEHMRLVTFYHKAALCLY